MTFHRKYLSGDIYLITLEDGRILKLHRETLDRDQLWIKNELSEDDVQKIIKSDTEYTLEKKAKELLERRDYSSGELFTKLYKWEKNKELRQTVVDGLVANGRINDERYAENVADYFITVKHFSLKNSLERMIYYRHIDRNLAEKSLEKYADNDSDNLDDIINRKYSRYFENLDDIKIYRKVINSLMRQGFKYEEIRKKLDVIKEEYEE